MQNWHKISFFAILSSLHHQFSLMLHRIAAWENTSSRAETSKKKKKCPKLEPKKPKSGPKWGFSAFSFLLYVKRKDLIKLIFHVSWLHRISFIYNPTASFLRHRITEWPWIKLKMRPMPFKKSWNLFCSDVIEHLVKLVVNNIVFFLWSIKNLLRVCMWVCLSVCACVRVTDVFVCICICGFRSQNAGIFSYFLKNSSKKQTTTSCIMKNLNHLSKLFVSFRCCRTSP